MSRFMSAEDYLKERRGGIKIDPPTGGLSDKYSFLNWTPRFGLLQTMEADALYHNDSVYVKTDEIYLSVTPVSKGVVFVATWFDRDDYPISFLAGSVFDLLDGMDARHFPKGESLNERLSKVHAETVEKLSYMTLRECQE